MENVNNLDFYSTVYPSKFKKLETPFTPKQFSPCGRYLISFGLDQVVIQSYCYDLPQMFTTLHTLDLEDVISTEFSLFSTCTEYVIFATARNSSESRSLPSSLRIIPNLDDITLWLVHLETGKIRDKLEFKSDYIYLSNHSGVSLYENLLGITSVQHQTIYFYKLVDGKFVSCLNLGWWNRDDDELFMMMHEERVARFDNLGCEHGQDCFGYKNNDREEFYSIDSAETLPNDDDAVENPNLIMSGLKQRMMSYLYRQALDSSNPQVMSHFYLTFGYFRDLIMWRTQFLDSGINSINQIDHILIKFGSITSILGRGADSSSSFTAFFVIYCLSSTNVLGIYEIGSQEMLNLYLSYDCFRGSTYPSSSRISSPSNNKYALEMLEKSMYAIRNARNGGVTQSIKRVLASVPTNPQNYSESPYFDLDLYSYDDKVVNPVARLSLSLKT